MEWIEIRTFCTEGYERDFFAARRPVIGHSSYDPFGSTGRKQGDDEGYAHGFLPLQTMYGDVQWFGLSSGMLLSATHSVLLTKERRRTAAL